jgi:vitamin B12 transporter
MRGSGIGSDAPSALRAAASALAAAALLSGVAFAADETDASAPDRIVVTGAASPVEARTIGASLTVVPGALIEAQGYSFAADVLRQVPGVAVSRVGAAGGLTQARIRGAEANHTLVMIDGIDVTSPDLGEADFSTLLAGELARIEVLRGPQSGLYGSNALAGVVNLVTRRDVDGADWTVALEGGEQGALQLRGSAGIGNGADYASAAVQALRTEGYDISAETASLGVPFYGAGGTPGDAEGVEVVALMLRGGAALTPRIRVDGLARLLDKTAELDGQSFGFPIAGRTYDDASTSDTRQRLVGGAAELELLDGRWTSVASASFVEEERRNLESFFPFDLTAPPSPAELEVPLAPSGVDATRETLALRSTLVFGGPGLLSRLTGFAERKEETFENAFPGTPGQAGEHARTLQGVGVEYRAEIAEQLFLSAALRHDDNDAFADADTWSLAAAWAIPGTGARPHASVGAGVANPTFVEQFGFDPDSFVGNPTLVPEEAEGWEVGLEQTLFDGRAVLDVTAFESTLEREIFTDFSSFPFTAGNAASESERHGWEVSFRVAPRENLDVSGSLTSLDATEPEGAEVRRPETQAALDASWRVGGGPLMLNLGVSHVGAQTDTDFSTFERVDLDAFTLARLGASWRVSDSVELYGRVENLLDEDYEEVVAFRGAPRAAYVGVRFRGGARR